MRESGAAAPVTRRRSVLPAVVLGVWLTAAAGGMTLVARHAATAGAAHAPPGDWPVGTALAAVPGRPNLLLFVHPRCPCSRATIGELAKLLARTGDRVAVRVMYFRPAGVAPAGWDDSALLKTARGLRGVVVEPDPDGVAAHAFSARTSGWTVLYDPEGRLRFAGGITASRGHDGDNDGVEVIERVLLGTASSTRPAATPVFGCGLTGN